MMTSEEFLISKLGSISVDKKYPYGIIFEDSEGYVVMYNRKNSYLYVDYTIIWSVFEKQYCMKYKDIQTFITNMMLKHLNWRPETPIANSLTKVHEMLKHLNWRPETPCQANILLNRWMLKHLNWRPSTPFITFGSASIAMLKHLKWRSEPPLLLVKEIFL